MSQLSFEEAVARLGEFRTRGWRLGLDRMREFLLRLGLEHKLGRSSDSELATCDSPRYIHVAGTNGKGSVCAYLQSMLHEQGYRVGATYSPYVYDVRERVQLGRDLISKADFARLTATLLEVGATLDDTELGGPTEFEMKTALGFLYWAEKQCDWVALEVGLGGRLDATNVITPACSVIVSIGLDHTHILGDTFEQIAREKAGIIKPGRPVVVGSVPEGALREITEIAEQNGSPLFAYGRDFEFHEGTVQTPKASYTHMQPGIKGAMQGHNLAVAVAAMELAEAIKDEHALSSGAALATLPGRFESRSFRGRKFILDGAHNPEAARHLVETLRNENVKTPLHMITGRLEGHDNKDFFDVLKPVVIRTHVATIDFYRTMTPSEVIAQAGLSEASAHDSAAHALEAALDETKEGETILVTGSFYIVGEIGNLMTRGSSPGQ